MGIWGPAPAGRSPGGHSLLAQVPLRPGGQHLRGSPAFPLLQLGSRKRWAGSQGESDAVLPGGPGCAMRGDTGRLPSPGASRLSGAESCKLGAGRGAPALSSSIWSRALGGGHRGPWLPLSSGPKACLPPAQITTGDQWPQWSGSPPSACPQHLPSHLPFLPYIHPLFHPSIHLPTCPSI